MGTTPLREFLISLCTNTHWKYAVFWKLKHQTPLILTWEDGYFDTATEAETSGIKSYDNYVDEAKEISLRHSETRMHDFGFQGSPTELAVANMSTVKYAFGEGLVGEVACTGNHMWVSVNSFFTGEFHSNLSPDGTDECLLQIAMGIKTILLVPVLPNGVIQLGSFEAILRFPPSFQVAENVDVVGLVRDRFDAYCHMMEETVSSALISNRPWSSSNLLSFPVDNINMSTCLSIKHPKCEELEDMERSSTNDKMLSTAKLPETLQTVQDMFLGAEKEVLFGTTSEQETVFPGEPVLTCLSGTSMEILDNKIFGFPCLEEELLAYSLSTSQNTELWGIAPYSVGEIAAETMGIDHISDGDYNSLDIYKFPEDGELHKALGPPFQENPYEHLCYSSFLIEEDCNKKSSVEHDEETMDINGPSWLAGECDAEHLLEAIIANLCSSSDDPLSSPSTSVPSCITSLRQSSTFCQPQVQSKEVPKKENRLSSRDITAPARVDSSVSLDGMASTLTTEEQQVKGRDRAESGKGKRSNTKTSRTRNGNNPKPRPRDRQLIQDRVKELRELVPNGSKCSIDGLLDRTIKHMLYLRSVSDQAEKLKQHPHQEVLNGKNRRSSETNTAPQNGASWGFEIGNERQLCPIVVEDLESPGQMLIEVLCDDHGLFLEIAQLIRRLDLTILKGTLENGSSETRACFVVEATKGFHRMEIFWPVLHLLQRKRSRISTGI